MSTRFRHPFRPTGQSLPARLAAALLLAWAGCAPMPGLHGSAHAQTARSPQTPQAMESRPAWQREAVPFYDTVHALQGIYAHHATPQAQAWERSAQALTGALAALCQASPGSDAQAALQQARTAWRSTAGQWEALSAVAIGPVIARRTQRAIDFAPTRPALIEKAIQIQPQGAAAMERVGTPAKGLPALEWLLWTRPMQPSTPACSYAHEVALDIAREAAAVAAEFARAAQTDWGAEEQQEASTQAMSEFVNQWVGGMERLRWAHMEKPLRAAQGGKPPEYPRSVSQSTLAAWAATWQGLRSVTVQSASAAAPAPGAALVPLATYLRGKGQNLLADKLQQAVQKVDASMAQVQRAGVRGKAAIQQAARDLAALKFLAESEVAPALQVSIGFSDADGD